MKEVASNRIQVNQSPKDGLDRKHGTKKQAPVLHCSFLRPVPVCLKPSNLGQDEMVCVFFNFSLAARWMLALVAATWFAECRLRYVLSADVPATPITLARRPTARIRVRDEKGVRSRWQQLGGSALRCGSNRKTARLLFGSLPRGAGYAFPSSPTGKSCPDCGCLPPAPSGRRAINRVSDEDFSVEDCQE